MSKDTEKVEQCVCLAHSGIKSEVSNLKVNQTSIWRAIGQMRAMFVVTMLSTCGTLVMLLWQVLSKKVGL